MTKEEIIQAVIAFAGDDYDEATDLQIITILVDEALEEVIHARRPYLSSEISEVNYASYQQEALTRYGSTIRRIAQYHYDKQGKEGVVSYTENGTTASYENGSTPPSMLSMVIPVAQFTAKDENGT